jgi:hypothetical protein
MGFVCRNLPNVIQSVCSRWLTPMHIVFTLHITCSSHLPYTHTAHTSWFRNKTLVAAAGAQCAQPALAPGLSCSNLAPTGKYPMVCPLDPKGAGGAGDFCVCSETGHAGVCVPVPGVPEQINLQVWKTSPPCAKPCGFNTVLTERRGCGSVSLCVPPCGQPCVVHHRLYVFTRHGCAHCS